MLEPIHDAADAVRFADGLTTDDVPAGLSLGSGLTVTDPAAMLADLRTKLASTGRSFALGVERAHELRAALAALRP